MPEQLSHFLDTALAVILGVIGWIVKKFADRLDKDEERLTKIEVELATQRERDTAVENRMSGLESTVKEINGKLDRMMEILMKR
jgi:predicted  nucleic acid-binding Zn-ribbon protein